MEENNLGMIIKELRKKKNITQAELADGICSLSQLYRIEKGKNFPSFFILNQLSNKLGEDISKYSMYSNCNNPLTLSLMFNKLEKLRLERNYSEILFIISEVRESHEFRKDISLPRIKQLLYWYEGICLSNNPKFQNKISVNYYINLLKLTREFSDIMDLFNSVLNINEIKILHSIAATYCRNSQFIIAKNILLSLIKNIKSYHDAYEISLMPEIYYNLSKLLFLESDYNNSIFYANKGLNIFNNNFSRVFADLFYILGQCYEKLNKINECIKNYNKFICLYDILGHDSFSYKCKVELLSKYRKKIITLSPLI